MKGMFVLQTLPFVCGLFGPHLHPHRTKFVICGARTCTPFFAHACAPASEHKKNSKKKFFLVFFYLKLSFFYKKEECADVRCTSAPKKGARTHPHAHLWKFLRTPLHKNRHTRTCAHVRARAGTHIKVFVCSMQNVYICQLEGGRWSKLGKIWCT